MSETVKSEILIVDDEADIRNLIEGILEDEGYRTRTASSAKEAYKETEKKRPDLIVLDIWLRGSEQDGLEILQNVKKQDPHLPILMISGHGTIETAVSSIKKGAYDFIEKPFKADRLLLMIRRALEAAALKRENEALRQKTTTISEFVGRSPAIQNITQMIKKVAATKSRVLLTGEPGTGKDVAAQMIYQCSARAGKPFTVIHCATLRPEEFESILFGTVKKPGVLESVNNGTLFLDEVADMPLETQGKIVRVLQEQRFQKEGGHGNYIEVDIRIFASTNRDLNEEVKNGNFREDLYYRLNVVPIHMPPLREHREDIPELVEYFVNIFSQQSGMPSHKFTKKAMMALKNYDWPGNVRQLRNTLEWTLIMKDPAGPGDIDIGDLPPEIQGQGVAKPSVVQNTDFASNFEEMTLREAREAFEREYLENQVNRFDGNISKTAEFIGMERSALHRKLKTLKIAGDKKETSPEGDDEETIRKRA